MNFYRAVINLTIYLRLFLKLQIVLRMYRARDFAINNHMPNSDRAIIAFFPITDHFISEYGFRFTWTLRNARVNVTTLLNRDVVSLDLSVDFL